MPSSRCSVCGKPLTRDASIERGIGDVCASKLNAFREAKRGADPTKPESDYIYHIIEIKGKKVGVVIDKDTAGYMSVTNNIDGVCGDIGVDQVIYRDSDGVWDFWSEKTGFKSLALNGEPTYNMDSAIDIAKSRFFDDIGGLFE